MAFWDRDHYGPIQQIALVTTLLLGLLFSCLDASIVSTSLVSISAELRDFINAPWIVISYLLAYLGFAIFFGKMSDIHGRRPVLCVAWILFVAFSIGCALAKTMVQLIVFRALQGVGASGLYSLAQTCLFEAGPSHNPGLLGGLIGITLAIAYVLGPVLGGSISYQMTWRWVFWINIPFGCLAILVVFFAWPRHVGNGLGYGGWRAFKKIDFPGNILILVASTLLVFALQEGGTFTYQWISPIIVSTLTLSGVAWIAIIAWEVFLGMRNDPFMEPVIPMTLLHQRVFLAALMCTIFTGYTYLSIVIILPERFQIVNRESALSAGIHLLPLLGATAFGSFVAGAASKKRNNTSPTMIISSVLQLIGVGLMATLREASSIEKVQYAYQVILGLGLGLSLAGATMMASIVSKGSDLAVAHAVIAMARVFGGAIGIAACSIIFNARVETQLSGVIAPDALQALHHSPTITQYIPAEQQSLVSSVYAAAFADETRMLVAVCAVGLISALFTFERSPRPIVTSAEQVINAEAARRQASKDALGGGAQSSETELDELVLPRGGV